MTKFEEEFNYLIELSGKVLIGQVDAEAFEKNRIAFFKKYETDQQQALQVVQPFVAEEIESAKKAGQPMGWSLENPRDAFEEAKDTRSYEFRSWIFGGYGYESASGHDYRKNQELFARAWLDGYQVEKPQLFYLKHIDMSKRNSINNIYLRKYIHANLTKDGEQRLSHSMITKGGVPKAIDYMFTQQEIDSMQTGSYEQIKVEEEK